MKRNRVVLIVLALMVALGTIAFAEGKQEDSGDGDQWVIGITYQNLANEYTARMGDGVRMAAKELGVKLLEADGQGSGPKQVSQAENFVAQGADAIILSPYDRSASAPVVTVAVDAGIPCILVNSLVDTMDLCDVYVGSDSVESGRMEMRYMAEQLGGKGNIVIIRGPLGHSAEIDRTNGIMEVLENYPDIKILADQPGDWDRAKGLNLMENWITSGMDIDGVVGQNDEMALGAVVACEAAGILDEVKIIGIDAIPDALQAVKDGKMIATIFQDAIGQGKGCVEAAVKILEGQDLPDQVMIPYETVTPENVDEYM